MDPSTELGYMRRVRKSLNGMNRFVRKMKARMDLSSRAEKEKDNSDPIANAFRGVDDSQEYRQKELFSDTDRERFRKKLNSEEWISEEIKRLVSYSLIPIDQLGMYMSDQTKASFV